MNSISDSNAQELSGTLLVLQTPSASFEDRLNALRYLSAYLRDSSIHKMDETTRSNINKVLFDSVLELLMGGDYTPDLRKRQLVRTECFIMLANVLKSHTLFGDAYAKIQISELFGKLSAADAEDKNPVSDDAHQSPVSPTRAIPRIQSASTSEFVEGSLKAGGPSAMLSQSTSVLSLDSSSAETRSSLSPSRRGLGTRQRSNQRKQRAIVYNTLRSQYQKTKVAHMREKKGLKPRQGIIFGSAYDKEHFVPGGDPTNWSDQDRRLGYRKERMWFPLSVGINRSIIPPARESNDPHAIEPEQIVTEYLQMKALMSYVGDMVMVPHSGAAPTPGKPRQSGKGPSPLEQGRYDAAVREAVKMWTPLLGANLPPHARRLLMAHADAPPPVARAQPVKPFGPPAPPRNETKVIPSTAQRKMDSIYDAPAHAPAKAENSVLMTKQILRQLHEMELSGNDHTRASIRGAFNAIMSDRDGASSAAGKWPKHVQNLQDRISSSLNQELESVENSARVLRALMLDTIKLQYAQLPPRYLVVLEKEQPSIRNPRLILMRALKIFVRTKERTLLALALGIWRICLVKAVSDANKTKYSKVASCHLIRNWIRDRKFKQFKQWVVLWRSKVSKVIFQERFNAVVPIQTLYRRWRDRKILLRMHAVRPYNGPLSDIYLAEDRTGLPGVKFVLPHLVRNSRRIYWRASVKIQTKFRSYKQGKLYKKRIKQIVVLQSVCRMFPKRKQYLRLKRVAIYCQACMRGVIRRKMFVRWRQASYIVQKYIRRFLGIMKKWRLFEVLWNGTELYIPPAIRIQCRWRVALARAKVKSIKFEAARVHWGALVMQRNWYRLQNAFHTFVLMCSYRAREGADKAIEKRRVWVLRFHNCRKIQRAYRHHYFKRTIAAAVKLQCWYRGRCGYSLVHILRKNKMAARRLHHWARGMMRKKHAFARKIQRCWWQEQPGRLRKHLMNRARHNDEVEQRVKREIRDVNAARMQAIVRGIWARRWVVLHKAALKIQRSSRFFISRLMCKKAIRDKAAKAIKKSVGNMIGRGLVSATNILVARHNRYVAQLQALIRGFVLRAHFQRAKDYAFKLGLAVVTIQRFWRKSGAFMKAVQEVMALRRLDTNPYRSCVTIHEILLQMRAETRKYYSSTDPRCGMTVSTFLRRLGLSEFLPMFPPRDFRLVADLQRLNEERMVVLYNRYLVTDKKAVDKDRKKSAAALAGSAIDALPALVRQGIRMMLTVLKPEIPVKTTSEEERLAVAGITAVPEVGSGHSFKKAITEIFVRRFGAGYQSRVENLVATMSDQIWYQYSNYKSLGYFVVTEAQIERAIALSKTPSDVKANIDSFQDNPQVPATLSPAGRAAAIAKILNSELQWDTERTKLAAESLQLAAEKAVMVLPEGSILNIIQVAMHYVGLFKRRFIFLIAKLRDTDADLDQQDEEESIKDEDIKTLASAALVQTNEAAVTVATEDSSHSTQQKGNKKNKKNKKNKIDKKKSNGKTGKKGIVDGDVEPVKPAVSTVFMKPVESVGRHFYSKRYEEGILEMNIGICKIYMEAFDKIFVASSGIQNFINRWQTVTVKRAIVREQMNRFLNENTEEYLKDRHTNKVLIKWQKYRRAEAVAARFNELLEARRARLEYMDNQLYWVCRWGWEEALDAHGYTYWYKTDELLRRVKPKRLRDLVLDGEEAENHLWSYEMPKYTREEYVAAVVIQVPARALIEYVRERRRIKEVAKRAEVAAREAQLKEQMQENAGKIVRFRINLAARPFPWLANQQATGVEPNEVSEISGGADGTGYHGDGQILQKSGRPGQDRPSSPTTYKGKSKGRTMKDNQSSPRRKNTGKIKIDGIKKSPSRWQKTNDTPPAIPLSLAEQEETVVAEAVNAFNERIYLSEEDQHDAFEKAAVALLPFKLRFEPEEDAIYKTGTWILVQDFNDHDLYRSAVMFHTNSAKRTCSVRYISGCDERKVPFSRLVQLNLEIGTKVEVRYHGRKLFYRAVVKKISGILNEKKYTVQYEDGEIETDIVRGDIRLSNEIVDELLSHRRSYFVRMYLRVRRETHYSHMRGRREAAMAARNLFRWQQLPEEIRNPHPKTPFPPIELPVVPMEMTEVEGNFVHEEIIKDDGAGIVVATDEGARTTAASGSDTRSTGRVDQSLEPFIENEVEEGMKVERNWRHDKVMPQLIKANVSLVYVKFPLRFGWTQQTEIDPLLGTKVFSFTRLADGVVTDVPQVYDAEEIFNVIKIQSMIRVRLARRYIRKLLTRQSMSSIARGAINRSSKICWIGYGFEGMTASQLLYRTGNWRLVNLIEEFFRSQAKLTGHPQNHLTNMSVPTFVKITPDQFGPKLGVLNQNDVKSLTQFMGWYHKAASDDVRLADIAFINGYRDEFDSRTIVQCIRSAEQVVSEAFAEAFPNNALRLKTVGRDVCKSLFPISNMQLNSYIEIYLPKPGAAVNCINELTNKPTTSVYQSEMQVAQIFRAAARGIYVMLAALGLRSPQKIIGPYIEQAEELIVMAKNEIGRPNTSGREAQAALILRRHVLAYVVRYEGVVVTVQRRLRGITSRIKWLKRKERLRAAVQLAQRLYRGLIGRRIAAALSAEKFSDWEQLWNDKRQLMYYYNKITQESTYREPRGPFRPLMRDRRSYALMQAWPDLEGGLGLGTGEWRLSAPTDAAYIAPVGSEYDQVYMPPADDAAGRYDIYNLAAYDPSNSMVESTWGGESEWDTQAETVLDPMFASTETGTTTIRNDIVASTAEQPPNPMMCGLCKARKYTRLCYDCTGVKGDLQWAVSYTNGAYSSKFCFSCFALAHPIDDPDTKEHRTEENTLSKSVARLAVFQQDTLGATEDMAVPEESVSLLCSVCSQPATRKCMGPLDDRQIETLCAELHKASASSWVSILQNTGLWSERRLRLLLEQVKGVDMGGSNVGASGRLSLAQVQELRIVLERTRAECDDCYCTSCYQDVHSGGKRSTHKWIGFQENAPVCAVCSHSAAEVVCKDCNTNYCNACFRVFHSKGRKKKHMKEVLLEETYGQRVSRCSVCVRRIGSVNCPACEEPCCDSCLECGAHKSVCIPNPMLSPESKTRPGTTASASGGREFNTSISGEWGASAKIAKKPVCVVCGEPADQECVQCRDHYCSRVWMGNPGCFSVQHSKGNRSKHVSHPIKEDFDDEPNSQAHTHEVGSRATTAKGSLPSLATVIRPGSRQSSTGNRNR